MKNLLLFTLLLLTTRIMGQSEKPSSPYFMVTSQNTETDALPLKNTKVTVTISGVIADVLVEQTYINEGKQPIEAIYVFPGSTNAAVYGMQMQIGDRIIEAKIEEKEKARNIYTKAKEEGKRASLLEQHRPNVFQMNVANILPEDVISVTLRYTELLIPESGIYQFVYPTVVGPRYINGGEQTNTSYAGMPYQHSGQTPLSSFELSIQLASGVPIDQVSCNTHPIEYDQKTPTLAFISLSPSPDHGNRDFVLSYSLRGQQIQSGLLLYENGKEKYFLCVVQPPKQVELAAIPPREYIFVVDVSGSMNGFPLNVSKKLLTDLIGGLRPNDMFNVLMFSGGSKVMSPASLPATAENIAFANDMLTRLEGGGSTELLPALRQSFGLPRQIEGLSRSIIVVTDGYVGVEPEAFELIRTSLHEANLFAFGIGSSVNRHLIEGMAHVGQGLPAFILNENEAPAAAEKFRQYISNPVFTQISASFEGFDAYDIEPISIPDVLAERPVVLFGKWRGKPAGHIHITGFTGDPSQSASSSMEGFGFPKSEAMPGKKVTLDINVNDAVPNSSFSALKYLWARERLRRLSDYNQLFQTPEQIKEITNLGLDYHMLTAYTSFVAVENIRSRHKQDSLQTVYQPLPMPEGVSDSAVGFSLNISGISGQVRSSFILPYLIILGLIFIAMKCYRWIEGKEIGQQMILLLAIGFTCSCNDRVAEINTHDSTCTSGIKKITFILGTDEDAKNTYYDKATRYFNEQARDGTTIVVTHIRSFQALYNYLATQNAQEGPWEEINLVVHGNRWTGIALPLKDGAEERVTSTSLRDAIEAKSFKPICDGIIDCNTRVNIFGCSLGLDRNFVNCFNEIFINTKGDEAMIFASQYFNMFYTSSSNPDSVGRCEAACYFIPFPIEKTPSDEELVNALLAKYPDANINWSKALQQNYQQQHLAPFKYQFYIPVEWTFLYEDESERPSFKWQDQIRSWVAQQPGISSTLEGMDFSPDDFWWKTQSKKYSSSLFNHQPAMVLKGSTRIYCVLVPITLST